MTDVANLAIVFVIIRMLLIAAIIYAVFSLGKKYIDNKKSNNEILKKLDEIIELLNKK